MGTSEAESEIRARIRDRGKVTFAEFMETALYRGGYYSSGPVGYAHGDYFTSPAVHPAFGALVAVLLMRMWDVMERPATFHVVEMGSGTGRLARDILGYLRSLPSRFGEALHYIAVDRAAIPRVTDEDSMLHYITSDGLPLKPFVGCVLSNELLDAFPVNRFKIQGDAIAECYVTLDDGEFVEVIDEPSDPELSRRIDALGADLPDGFQGEVNLGVRPWAVEISRALRQGFVLTIDYGYESTQLYSLDRATGTLRTYHNHTQAVDPYRRIGRQDLTAHVDFSAVRSEGLSVGLNSLALLTQSQLLRALGIETWLGRLRSKPLSQSKREANAMAMRELIRPDGLGSFKALVQEKCTGVSDLGVLLPTSPVDEQTQLPIPFLSDEHVNLLASRYPHAAVQLEQFWPH